MAAYPFSPPKLRKNPLFRGTDIMETQSMHIPSISTIHAPDCGVFQLGGGGSTLAIELCKGETM